MTRESIAALALASLASVLAIAALFRAPEPPVVRREVANEDRAVADELRALRQALEQEGFEREMLAAELALMRTVIEQIASERAAAAGPEPELAPDSAATRRARGPAQAELDERTLLELGLAESEVRALRERWDAAQLERLELNDRAAREGWLFRPRHRRQVDQLDAALRAELGESAYDQMLYATGQPNRVVVTSVIGGSAAEIAGLREGDRVISYGSERVFRPKDVRAGTIAGERGERVRIVVERNGQTRSYVVPRGPLGVRMTAESAAPER